MSAALRSSVARGYSLRILRPSRSIECVRYLSTSTRRKQDEVTHTGQYWEKDDYRNVRFVDKQKQVNKQFAIDLVAEESVVVIDGNHTFCDGGAALGHPRVYINLDRPEIQDCGYCGKRFVSTKNKELFTDPALTFVQ